MKALKIRIRTTNSDFSCIWWWWTWALTLWASSGTRRCRHSSTKLEMEQFQPMLHWGSKRQAQFTSSVASWKGYFSSWSTRNTFLIPGTVHGDTAKSWTITTLSPSKFVKDPAKPLEQRFDRLPELKIRFRNEIGLRCLAEARDILGLSPGKGSLLCLYDEILETILRMSKLQAVCRLAQTCKRINNLTQRDSLWKLMARRYSSVQDSQLCNWFFSFLSRIPETFLPKLFKTWSCSNRQSHGRDFMKLNTVALMNRRRKIRCRALTFKMTTPFGSVHVWVDHPMDRDLIPRLEPLLP